MSYKHPWIQAWLVGIGVFVIYQFAWRPQIGKQSESAFWGGPGEPAPLFVAVLAALTLGHALAMVIWLLKHSRSSGVGGFRPTRGRVISGLCLLLVTPILVFDWIPWIVVGVAPFGALSIWIVGLIALVVYTLAVLIQHQTYQRKLLRFGLFSLYFWGVYAFHILWHGAIEFVI